MEITHSLHMTSDCLHRLLERLIKEPATQPEPDMVALAYAIETGMLVMNTADSANRAALNSLAFIDHQLERVGLNEGSAQRGVLKLIELSGLTN